MTAQPQADAVEPDVGFDWAIHHSALSVPDLEASIAWYRRMLGFTLERRQFIEAIPAHIAFIRRGHYRIELFEVDGAEPLPAERRHPLSDVRTHGHKHICFAVADTRGALAALRARGADVVFEDVIDGTPMGFVRDISYNLVEFLEAPSLLTKQGDQR